MMKIDKIEIQTSNKKYRTDISMLVDKEEFVKEINKLRSEWQIKELYPYSNFQETFLKFHVMRDGGKVTDNKEIERRLFKFNEDIDKILEEFHRDRSFKPVVEYALACGVIPDYIYKSCYFDKVTIGEPEDLSKPERYQYVIVMSPRTEQQEVIDAYKEFQEFIRGYEPKHEFDDGVVGKIDWQHSEGAEDFAEYEHFIKGPVYNAADISKFKTKQNIDDIRDWYWLAYDDFFNGKSKKRKSSEDVLDEWQKVNCSVKTIHPDIESKLKCSYCAIENVNDIDQALSTYRKLLKQS